MTDWLKRKRPLIVRRHPFTERVGWKSVYVTCSGCGYHLKWGDDETMTRDKALEVLERRGWTLTYGNRYLIALHCPKCSERLREQGRRSRGEF